VPAPSRGGLGGIAHRHRGTAPPEARWARPRPRRSQGHRARRPSIGPAAPESHLHDRPDDVAHHVPQEPVSAELEASRRRLRRPRRVRPRPASATTRSAGPRPGQGAHGRGATSLPAAWNAAKSCRPSTTARASARPRSRGAGHVPAVPSLERVADGPVEDAVAVGFSRAANRASNPSGASAAASTRISGGSRALSALHEGRGADLMRPA
jgi:hypothetical protein